MWAAVPARCSHGQLIAKVVGAIDYRDLGRATAVGISGPRHFLGPAERRLKACADSVTHRPATREHHAGGDRNGSAEELGRATHVRAPVWMRHARPAPRSAAGEHKSNRPHPSLFRLRLESAANVLDFLRCNIQLSAQAMRHAA
jgi:hypothetical protein